MANQINDCKFNFYTNALAKRQAPNFNGVSQYAEFTRVSYQQGDQISIGVFAGSVAASSTEWILSDSLSDELRLFIFSDNGLYLQNAGTSSMLLDGSPFTSGSQFPTDGELHTITIILSQAAGVDSIGKSSGGFVSLKRIAVNYADSIGNVFPMDDGWSNNPTMRNTGTGADGTFINMTEAAWVEIDA